MPDTRKHRGPGPEDLTWFGVEAQSGLRAVADLSWLLSHGYKVQSALNLVGDRYRLVDRQRVAVNRSACSNSALASRRSRELDPLKIGGRPLLIDGFNLLLTLESALGGGAVLDGCYRDMARMHGTYRKVEETRAVLELAARWLAEWGKGPCTWLLLAEPVSRLVFIAISSLIHLGRVIDQGFMNQGSFTGPVRAGLNKSASAVLYHQQRNGVAIVVMAWWHA